MYGSHSRACVMHNVQRMQNVLHARMHSGKQHEACFICGDMPCQEQTDHEDSTPCKVEKQGMKKNYRIKDFHCNMVRECVSASVVAKARFQSHAVRQLWRHTCHEPANADAKAASLVTLLATQSGSITKDWLPYPCHPMCAWLSITRG